MDMRIASLGILRFHRTVYCREKLEKYTRPGRFGGICVGRKGFSLLEMAMVLAVLGLLLSFMSVAWISMKRSQQISSAKTMLEAVSNCLLDYVIHSRAIPPQSYFTQYCADTDPWGNAVVYYNSEDNQEIPAVVSKIVRDANNDHPDAAFVVVSPGPDGTVTLSSTTALWDCSSGDDLCLATSKNTLIYETSR